MKLELKKSLGQHFLINNEILTKINEEVIKINPHSTIVEVGPGMGALTEYTIKGTFKDYFVVEMDDRFVVHLPKKFPILTSKIIHEDILKVDLSQFGASDLTILGNFPYNISTQIVFLIIENYQYVDKSIGMFQKEVAKRIAASHGSKDYGILSVLSQSLYEVTYLFDIDAINFDPPPKVVSGVISMKRLEKPRADYKKLKILVKAAFNQRRKMLSNSIKGVAMEPNELYEEYKNLRPEQLSIEQFCQLSNYVITK